MMAKKPDPVHVDLLEIDMKTGAHWLAPWVRQDDEERKRRFAEYMAEKKRERGDSAKKSIRRDSSSSEK
jgi:hypothetical protein